MHSDPLRRLVLIALGLLIVSAVIGMTGAHKKIWALVSGPADPVRADMVAAATTDAPAERIQQEELAKLRAEVLELRNRLGEYEELDRAGSLGLHQLTFHRSRILARSADAGRHFLEIDRGAVEGVRVGQPVLTGWSLVGTVRGEQAGRSLVQLLTDEESRVPATILAADVDPMTASADAWVADGTCAGIGRQDELQMLYVEDRPNLTIMPGMLVVTAGLDANIPPGLIIGTVASAEPEPDSDLWHISVTPQRPWGSYPTVLIPELP